MSSDNEFPAERPEERPEERPAERPEDYRIPDEPEPVADEGESIAWMADADTHLADVERIEPPLLVDSGPLPVCDYTDEGDEPCEEPATERRWSSAAVITSAALGALVGGVLVSAVLVWALGLVPGTRPIADVVERPLQNGGPITITPGAEADVSEAVAEKVVPSVVNVSVRQAGVDPFTGQQFDAEASNGSGVIIREDGYILTNNHVVEGADRIVVTVGVEDKEARIVGVDPSSDLAVLKIEGSGFPAVELGASKDLKVGQYVMAVGSPFGFERTATVGIISALNRSELIQGQNDLTTYTNLIQTDAAINPGNSGGALVDDQGRLVGINTLIQSPSGSIGAPQSAGIGFAIPVDFAKDIAEQLIETGQATHPYMGVSTETVDENIASEFNLPVARGALVRFVQPDSPAEAAGIERGDIIVRIDDREITGVEDVFAAVREHDVGETVEVEVVRNDTRRTLDLTLGSDADRQ
jgi:putative serine protease PepD